MEFAGGSGPATLVGSGSAMLISGELAVAAAQRGMASRPGAEPGIEYRVAMYLSRTSKPHHGCSHIYNGICFTNPNQKNYISINASEYLIQLCVRCRLP